jgi:hypothetical protein
MDTMLGFAGLVVTTLVALFAALALEAALLRAMIALMKPATAGRRSAKPQIAQGARLVAEAYGKVR